MRIFFGCIQTPAETAKLGPAARTRTHVYSLVHIGRFQTSLTAAGKKFRKIGENARDWPLGRLAEIEAANG